MDRKSNSLKWDHFTTSRRERKKKFETTRVQYNEKHLTSKYIMCMFLSCQKNRVDSGNRIRIGTPKLGHVHLNKHLEVNPPLHRLPVLAPALSGSSRPVFGEVLCSWRSGADQPTEWRTNFREKTDRAGTKYPKLRTLLVMSTPISALSL